jgi:glycosyltransferase involved in cell wall biosynthesis
MRICYLGDYSNDRFDEGMKNVASNFSKELSGKNDVVSLDINNAFMPSFWAKLKKFDPEIIHYVPGPSISSFFFMKKAGYCCKNAKLVMSAYHATSLKPRILIPLLRLRPHLILTVSKETDIMLRQMGCHTKFLPPGVNTNKFLPIGQNEKDDLRAKYKISTDKFIILHVGHINEDRNIRILEKVQDETNQVIIVGSTTTKINRNLQEVLLHSGCLVWAKYFDRIEEIYALSDCYVFPTKKKMASIELPLSILEAMSCNLGVISTRFGGITDIFKEDNGLKFFEYAKDLDEMIYNLRDCNNIDNRSKVLPLSWNKLGLILEKTYEDLIITADN